MLYISFCFVIRITIDNQFQDYIIILGNLDMIINVIIIIKDRF